MARPVFHTGSNVFVDFGRLVIFSGHLWLNYISIFGSSAEFGFFFGLGKLPDFLGNLGEDVVSIIELKRNVG